MLALVFVMTLSASPRHHDFSWSFIPAQAPQPKPSSPITPWVEIPVVMKATKATDVACGLTLVPGDATIDPALPHPTPDRAAQGTMRTIPAPPCGR